MCWDHKYQHALLPRSTAFIPSATRLCAAPHSREDGVSHFPSCNQAFSVYTPKPVPPRPSHYPCVWPRPGCTEETEREAALCCKLLGKAVQALAVQAGGIEGDSDQSPSAPSLRVPWPPQLQVRVLANHMFTLHPSRAPSLYSVSK